MFDRALRTRLVAVILSFAAHGGTFAAKADAAELAKPQWSLSQAIDEAAGYLARNVDDEGRFAYLLSRDGVRVNPKKYNILRHSGAIYALTEYRMRAPDTEIRRGATQAAERAARELLSRYVKPIGSDSAQLGVWSDPAEERGPKATAKLGGAALGMIGLLNLDRATGGYAPALQVAQGLASFIRSMQEPNGDFVFKYSLEEGKDADFDSLYYPGEAILALTMLYEVDHDRTWLDAAAKGVGHLVNARRGIDTLPADHWLMIAIDRLLPFYDLVSAPVVSRDEIIEHSVAIGQAMMAAQTDVASRHPEIDGCFTEYGRTAPSATRLEGLLALAHTLARDPGRAPIRNQVTASIARGIAFLRRAQITSGPLRGGFPAALTAPDANLTTDDKRTYVRIDYVQHALVAMLHHAAMCKDETLRCAQ